MAVNGIVLAAGLSSRMEKYKMSLKIGDKTVIERCIESMYDVCFKIIVVCGYNYNVIEETLKAYSKVKIVLNPNYMEGMFSSVKVGLKNVSEEHFFLIPGDYPIIKKDTYEKMIKSKDNIIIPTYAGRKGHQILINSNYINKIINNSTYKSLRDFIKEYGFTAIELQDQGILMDIDTIEDYEKVLSYYEIEQRKITMCN